MKQPVLDIIIEWHRGTVRDLLGLNCRGGGWTLRKWVAACSVDGYRQLYTREKPLKTGTIVDEIAQLIINKASDERPQYYDDGRVKVLIGKIIPDDSAGQTVQGRRKRFRRDLTERLAGHGYRELCSNLYAPTGPDGNESGS